MSATTRIALKALALSASSLALVHTAPAIAQVDEIIVTAQKVEENVQDVPIAITAVSAERLDQAGVFSLENVSTVVPSVTFRKGTTSANSAIVMRGVGTITFSIAAEPSVSTVVDGVVLSRSGQAFMDLVDIERLEVLRGPQGTLSARTRPPASSTSSPRAAATPSRAKCAPTGSKVTNGGCAPRSPARWPRT